MAVCYFPSVCTDAFCQAPSPSSPVLVDASLPPVRACPDGSALTPGCSCSSVWKDTLCPAPSPSAQVFVDASLPPVRACPDVSVLTPGCSCSSVWKDALYPAPSYSAPLLVDVSLSFLLWLTKLGLASCENQKVSSCFQLRLPCCLRSIR